MSEIPEEIPEIEEEQDFSFEDSIKILKDASKQIEEEQAKFKKKAIPLKKKKAGKEEVYEVEEEQLESLGKQYSIIVGSGVRFVNPLLKKWKIDPLNNEEIDTLSKAILNISESKIVKTVKKIESRFKSINRATKFINLMAVFWELIVPRYDQLLKSLEEIEAKRQGMVK